MSQREPETICDLPFVSAEFRWVESAKYGAGDKFRVRFRRPGDAPVGQFDVEFDNAQQFAAELEALAALIRARSLRAGISN